MNDYADQHRSRWNPHDLRRHRYDPWQYRCLRCGKNIIRPPEFGWPTSRGCVALPSPASPEPDRRCLPIVGGVR